MFNLSLFLHIFSFFVFCLAFYILFILKQKTIFFQDVIAKHFLQKKPLVVDAVQACRYLCEACKIPFHSQVKGKHIIKIDIDTILAFFNTLPEHSMIELKADPAQNIHTDAKLRLSADLYLISGKVLS